MIKRFSVLALALVLLGAGCFNGKTNAGADGGVFKTANAGQEWSQTAVVPTAAGIGTLSTTDVLNMEMDPQDKSFLYLGTRQNGLLYSEDGGVSWRQPRYEALKEGLVFDVEVDPKNVCTLYVAKGQRLYKTTNCLRSFNNETYVENRAGVNVLQVAVDWYDTKVLYIGLSNGDVLKSSDAGRTWQTILKTGEEVSSLLIHNTDSRQVLVSTFKKGLQKTTDGGSTWERVDGGLKDLKKSESIFTLVQSDDSGVVISASEYGLVRSTDFGSTWKPLKLLTAPGQVLIRAVGMDAQNPNTLYYASNATFYRSTDGGTTWDTEKFPSTRVPRVLMVDPENASQLYIGVATATES